MTAPKRRPARHPDAKERAVLVARVSTEEQNAPGTVSLKDQLAKDRSYAEYKGYVVVGEYSEAVSGTLPDDERPEMARLLRDARDGQFEVAIAMTMSRWSRDNLLDHLLIQQLEKAGARLELTDADIDQETDSGFMMASIQLTFADFQRRSLLRTMANGAHGKVLDGRWPSSRAAAPFGYQVVGIRREARLVIDPEEQATILEAVECVLNRGMSAEQTAQWLNDRGMNPRGSWRKVDGQSVHVPSRWTGHKVRLYLSRPTLTGLFTWGSGRFASRTLRGNLKYGGGVSMQVEPIITVETQEAVRKALSVFGARTEDELAYPWSKRIGSACGRTYTGTFRTARNMRTYRCAGKHTKRGEPSCDCFWIGPADQFEERAWQAVVARLGSAADLEQMARQHLALEGERATTAAEQREELVAEAAARRDRLQATASAMFKAGVDPELVASTVKAEQDAIEALERRAADIERYVVNEESRTQALSQVARLAEFMADRLPRLDLDGQRLIVATLDLHATFAVPADSNSVITITSRRGVGDLLTADLLPDGDVSSTEA
ncbi:MAG: recombinase family protein [Trebonia sp.]